MKVAIILGTRPEIIKMSPVIRELRRNSYDYFIVHTGQHYSYNMDKIFFEDLDLPPSHENLNSGSGSHAEETAKMLVGIEGILLHKKPDIVLVQGDTNTVLAGALAAAKLNIDIGHIEAGLRSYDRTMPEEINRVVTDHISRFLFTPTEEARDNVIREGIADDSIFVVGNTIVDSVYQNLEISNNKSTIFDKFPLTKKKYFIVTLHRQENVDNKNTLQRIFTALEEIFNRYQMPILYPVHPRVKKRLEDFSMKVPEVIQVTDPLGYLDFLKLESNAALILTDSGGIQEEACILKVPCVTIRENTERPETIRVGSNILAGTSTTSIIQSVGWMLSRERSWSNPFGDGRTSEYIVDILSKESHG